ncbi:Rnps1, partial [Symbiodinium sp. KB8]
MQAPSAVPADGDAPVAAGAGAASTHDSAVHKQAQGRPGQGEPRRWHEGRRRSPSPDRRGRGRRSSTPPSRPEGREKRSTSPLLPPSTVHIACLTRSVTKDHIAEIAGHFGKVLA